MNHELFEHGTGHAAVQREHYMPTFQTLDDFLGQQEREDESAAAVAQMFRCLAPALVRIGTIVARGPLAGDMGAAQGSNADGDVQKKLDVVADDCVVEALRDSPIGWILSEEHETPIELDRTRPLAVAIDPLDGSSNIETNSPVGTIFGVLPVADPDMDGDAIFRQPGTHQLAAGYCIYGPRTTLIMTLGQGTHKFTLDPEDRQFRLTKRDVKIPATTTEFALNASNARHWERPVRAYYDDCIAGDTADPGGNYNMRWIASLVAEAHRILARGGVFLYPRDKREGYEHGRLRLLYECNPIAFIVEQADGYATTGDQRILEVLPRALHQRVPMIFGSRREIRRIEDYYAGRNLTAARSQLFSKRGLFRS
jgi:fructose-1,6-bisphosphatase I